MATYFISDIHLSDDHPHLLKLFEHFIRHILKAQDTLYILGDLFEYWIGDDHASYTANATKELLKHLKKRQITWYFLAGNRDFLIGNFFLEDTHGILLPEKKVITFADQQILLLHGDTLCTHDHAYQAWRRRVNQKWLQKMFLILPLKWRRRLADHMREKSMAQGKYLTEMMMDVAETSVLEDFKEYKVNVMIHGHVHRPGVHIYDGRLIRYVLSDWDTMGNFLVYDGEFKLSYFSDKLN